MRPTPPIAVLLGTFLGCGPSPADRPPNVILICMDTVRADHLGCYGYDARPTSPALDALARRSTVFRDASATAGWTKPSVPSFLTGTYPAQHGVYTGSSKDEAGSHSDVLPQEATTLAEVFQDRGYATAAFVKNAQLRRGLGFEQGFDLYQDEAGDAREIRWRASDWLDERASDKPFFLYLHYLDAHWPYAVPDEYAAMFTSDEAVAGFRAQDWRETRDAINHGEVTLEDEERDAFLGLYDGSIRFIDDELGRLFARLDREGLAEDTVICVVSDHGEEFLEHGRLGHGHGLWQGLLHVPWILYVPGREGRVVDTSCSLVDLFPTLLSAAGVSADETWEGCDRLEAPDAVRPVFAEHLEPHAYQQAWREESSKIIRRTRVAAPELEPAREIEVGTRWEARVNLREDGTLVATRLRPRSEDPSDPTELKGVITELAADSFRLLGARVTFTADTELYGETHTGSGEARTLRDGMMVKARGAVSTAGGLEAKKVKLYPEDEEPEYEIRGTVSGGTLGDTVVPFGTIWVSWDEHTEIESRSTGKGPRLDREDVAAILAGEAGEQAEVEVEMQHFDLASDPDEQLPPNDVDEASVLRLMGFARALLTGRTWGTADRVQLSPKQLEDLKAIGYAE